MAGKSKKITDYTLARAIADLEKYMYRLTETKTAKKFTFNLEHFMKNELEKALSLTTKALDVFPYDKDHMMIKIDLLIEARSEIKMAEMRILQMNDLCPFGNEAKAKADMMLCDIYGNFESLIGSLHNKIAGSDFKGQGPKAGPDNFIGTPRCDESCNIS